MPVAGRVGCDLKDDSIFLTKSPVLNPVTQCHIKKKYDLKRRALDDARKLAAAHPEMAFTVYECPHCGKYHVGSVKK